MRRAYSLVLFSIVALAGDSLAQQTYTVGPGGVYNFTAIQPAIDAATTGDTITVYPAVYPENIHFSGKSLVLQSIDPSNPSIVNGTVIDGGGQASAVRFAGTETEQARLAGFTIRNGRAVNGGGICGGGFSTRTLARIEYNAIVGNQAIPGDGGGVAFCNGLIQYNRIVSNRTGRVDGLYQYELGDGGGLAYCDGPILNNEIVGNEASEDAGGLKDCDGLIQNNLIAGNRAYDEGGGLSGCDGVIVNNTIIKNRVEWRIRRSDIHSETAGRGGGLNHCLGVIRNCIIWGNYAKEDTPLYPPSHQIYESSAPSYTCIQDSSVGGDHNIYSNPRFAGWDGGNYRLAGNSPCIDAGIDGHWWIWEIRDLDRFSRREGARVDMGCYEYGGGPDSDGDLLSNARESANGTNPNLADTDGDGLRDGLEVARGSNPGVIDPPGVRRVPADHPTIQEAIGLSMEGDIIVVSPGEYMGPVQFCGIDITVQSERPDDPATVEGTVLQGTGDGPVVLFLGMESPACVLDGFTLIGGRGDHGGGVRGGTSGHHTHATIQRNIIKNNWVLRGGAGIGWCDGLIAYNQILWNEAGNDGGGISQCDGTIRGNVLSGNEAGDDGGAIAHCDGLIEANHILWNRAGEWGGGIARCRASIWRNTISGNTAGEDGGGIANCNSPIVGNTITENTTETDGGGICNCDGVVINNLVANNHAGDDGGGIHRSEGALIGNIVIGNTCVDSGGGISKSDGFIQNCTVLNNTAGDESGGINGCDGDIRNCIVWGNQGGISAQLYAGSVPTYSCIQDDTMGGEGNISVDPQLVGDLGRLSGSSPCIDAGNPAPDFNDAALPPGLGTARCDMGAYGGPNNDGWPAGASLPDLTGNLFNIYPTPTVVGEPIRFAGGVYNSETHSTAPGFWVEFWAVNNEHRVYLCDSLAFPTLDGGESAPFGPTWPQRAAYPTIPPGTYTIEMRLDVGNAVQESDETNNVIRWGPCVIQSGRPNLTVEGFDFSPQDVDPAGGTRISFSGTVENASAQPVPGGCKLEVRVWPAPGFEPTGSLACDAYRISVPISPGASVDLSTLPARTAYALDPGVYCVGIILDPDNEIAETNENDNLMYLPLKHLYSGPRPARARRWKQYR